MPTLLLALLMSASAADLQVELGLSRAPRSVLVMGTDGTDTAVAACADGRGEDAALDGVFTCGALALSPGSVQLGLAIDGRLVEVGDVVLPEAGQRVQVRYDGASTQVQAGSGLLEERGDAKPAGGATSILVRLSGDFSQGAPMLQFAGDAGSSQVSCRDDGTFPDTERNDGIQGCAGVAPGPEVRVGMQAAGAQPMSLGSFPVDTAAAVVALDIDASAGSGKVAPTTPWPWPATPPPEPEPPEPGPDPVPPEPGPDPSPVSGGEPLPPQPLVAKEAPGAHGGAASQTGRGLIDLLAVLAALAAGFGLAWVVLPRGPRLPPGVEPVGAPPVFEGGPKLTDRIALFRTTQPAALTQELVRRLAPQRSVLVVLPEGEGVVPVVGAPVYRSTSTDWEDVAAQLVGLAKVAGVPPALVVLGRDTLTAPGAVADDPPARLAEALPPGSWLAVVGGADAAPIGFSTPWRASLEAASWSVVPDGEGA